jgi:hypothetical protein
MDFEGSYAKRERERERKRRMRIGGADGEKGSKEVKRRDCGNWVNLDYRFLWAHFNVCFLNLVKGFEIRKKSIFRCSQSICDTKPIVFSLLV